MSIDEQEVDLLFDDTLEIENRCRNLLWTVSGDYSLDVKPDAALFRRSKEIALYEGIRQGAFARYFDRDTLSLYLIKKVYLMAEEESLRQLAGICIEEAVGERICEERPGIRSMRRKAMQDILEQEYEILPTKGDLLGRLRVAMLSEHVDDRIRILDDRLAAMREQVIQARNMKNAEELIALIDMLYNEFVDLEFAKRHGGLDQVLAVTMEELCEDRWEDFLSEELMEEAMEAWLNQVGNQAMELADSQVTEELEKKRKQQLAVQKVTPEQLKKAYSYVELNYGKSYLSDLEERRINAKCCRELHSDCSLYFTEGILKNPVRRNYQYEYAKRLRNKNITLYKQKKHLVHRSVDELARRLKSALIQRSEEETLLSDRGSVVASRVWRVGRSTESRIFTRQIRGDSSDYVVDILIDASGSQMKRQEMVALQAYILSETLSSIGLPHRIMSYCTFWDYTVLHRFREYEDPRSANDNLFDFVTSSNNRDGLALRAVSQGLLERAEEHKILIVLSDGRPYDVVVNRANARNPKPYQGRHAVDDTASEIRRLRSAGVSVLGVFAGEEKDLKAEQTIFGKDFAYISSVEGFARTVGKYLVRVLSREDF